MFFRLGKRKEIKMALKYNKIKICNYIHKRKINLLNLSIEGCMSPNILPLSVNLAVGLNSAPPSTYVEILTPSITVFRDVAFGRQFCLDEIMRVESSWWDWCFYKKRYKWPTISPFLSPSILFLCPSLLL